MTQASPTVSSTAYIKDKAPTDYNYAITSSAGTEGAAVTKVVKLLLPSVI